MAQFEKMSASETCVWWWRGVYSPKESALALTVWVPLVRVALISLVYWFQILTTLRTVTFI